MHRLPYHQRNEIIKMNHTNIIMKYLISYMMWTLVFYLIGYTFFKIYKHFFKKTFLNCRNFKGVRSPLSCISMNMPNKV